MRIKNRFAYSLSRFGPLILTAVMCQACVYLYRSVPNRTFHPADVETPITLFGRYIMEIHGAADTTSPNVGFTLLVDFIEDFPATTPVDSIPILVLDSFCFESHCLDSNYCVTIPSLSEKRRRLRLRKLPFMSPESYADPPPPEDLIVGKERIKLARGWTIFGEDVDLPANCVNDDLTVRLVARLYDRVTGEEIGREEKTIPFMIRRGKRVLDW